LKQKAVVAGGEVTAQNDRDLRQGSVDFLSQRDAAARTGKLRNAGPGDVVCPVAQIPSCALEDNAFGVASQAKAKIHLHVNQFNRHIMPGQVRPQSQNA
jgi:hypothetical protein